MQINRLFEIVYILLDKKITTSDDLAKHFEVSKRTIMRDIDTLSGAGVPIYTSRGKGGGISILDNYIFDKAAVSEEEQKQILYSLQSMQLTGDKGVMETLSKFSSLFNKSDSAWIQVDFTRWGDTEDSDKFDTLKRAIIDKKKIHITYANTSGQINERDICPTKLIFKSRSWYINAYCMERKQYRVFKVNRIIDYRITEESFEHIPQEHTEDKAENIGESREQVGDIGEHIADMELLFSKSVAFRLYDEFSPRSITKLSDGSYRVRTSMPDDGWLYSFLLSFGADVKVEAPKNVKDKLEEIVEKMRKNN